MKKLNAVRWKRFKESQEGKEAIGLFTFANYREISRSELLKKKKKYNPDYFRNFGNKAESEYESVIWFFYYRSNKSTELWLPKSVSKYINESKLKERSYMNQTLFDTKENTYRPSMKHSWKIPTLKHSLITT